MAGKKGRRNRTNRKTWRWKDSRYSPAFAGGRRLWQSICCCALAMSMSCMTALPGRQQTAPVLGRGGGHFFHPLFHRASFPFVCCSRCGRGAPSLGLAHPSTGVLAVSSSHPFAREFSKQPPRSAKKKKNSNTSTRSTVSMSYQCKVRKRTVVYF